MKDVVWFVWGASVLAQAVKNLPAMHKDTGSIHGSGRFPGEGNGFPFQYSCHGVAKSQV